MQPTPSKLQPEALLTTLCRHDVQFLVIGGIAGILLGADRITHDLDILVEDSDANAERLADALAALEARWRTGDEALPLTVTPRLLRSAQRHFWETKFGRLDTHRLVAGTASYEQLVEQAWQATVGEATVWVVSLPDLIAMKEAAGRPKDQLALLELHELERLESER
jgi:predicted nucleotidyltransferase